MDAAVETRRLHYLRPAPIVNIELKSRIGGEDFGDLAQALGHGSGGQQRIVAFAQVVVIDVEVEREQVDRNRVGEAGGQVLVLIFLRVGAGGGGELARLPGVE